jgi:Flp pilus assembly protein TadG
MLRHTKTVVRLATKLTTLCATLRSDQRGASAIEFSFFAGMLSLGLLNTADIAIYVYQRMEVENATQMGAQAAWKTCDQGHLPATKNCPQLLNAIQNAVQSTSLGTKVTLQSNSPSEGYYCLNKSNTLEYVSDVTQRPADCTVAGMPSLKPADFIQVKTTYAYAPIFSDITVARFFTTPITRTSFMRLD